MKNFESNVQKTMIDFIINAIFTIKSLKKLKNSVGKVDVLLSIVNFSVSNYYFMYI